MTDDKRDVTARGLNVDVLSAFLRQLVWRMHDNGVFEMREVEPFLDMLDKMTAGPGARYARYEAALCEIANGSHGEASKKARRAILGV